MEEQSPKIGLVEAILMLMIVVPYDVLEAVAYLLLPIPVIGVIVFVVMLFGDWIILPVIQFWLMIKGVKMIGKGSWALGGNLLDMIPGFDALPFRTIGLIVTIILVNRPEVAAVAKVAGAASGKPGLPTASK